MSRWSRSDMHDLTGQTVVVTGASTGIGLRTATDLAHAGAHVVLAVRSLAKGEEAAKSIAGNTEVRELDVADLGSVDRFASEWTGNIDVLVNNAGIMEVPFAVTSAGYESQAATNYLGPFVLTNRLLPHITNRVVFVGSQLHRMGKIHLDDLGGTSRPYKKSDAYRDSKLAITLLCLELQRRLDLADSPVRAIVAHPGIASTNLSRHAASGKITHAVRFLFNDTATGALSLLYAATGDIPGNSYVGPRGPGGLKGHPVISKPAAVGRDGDLAAALWSATEHLLGTSFSTLTSGELA
jgi:NAD(P)-dependent dehydrogenase (short-subunit alcohol dehydrogenase family)